MRAAKTLAGTRAAIRNLASAFWKGDSDAENWAVKTYSVGRTSKVRHPLQRVASTALFCVEGTELERISEEFVWESGREGNREKFITTRGERFAEESCRNRSP